MQSALATESLKIPSKAIMLNLLCKCVCATGNFYFTSNNKMDCSETLNDSYSKPTGAKQAL